MSKRVKSGNYSKTAKWTVFMAISGDDKGSHWMEIEQQVGTSTGDFYLFIKKVLGNINDGSLGRRRYFIMESLSTHAFPIIQVLIESRGIEWYIDHRIIRLMPL